MGSNMMVSAEPAADCRGRNTGPSPAAAARHVHHGQAASPDGRALEYLPTSECLRLAGTVPVGRVFYSKQAMPAVAMVNFALSTDGCIVFRTEAGGKLWSAMQRAVVAFEADRMDEANRSGWSVTVVGRAEEVTDGREVAALRKLGLDPWAPGERDHFIRIRPEIVTGRRIRSA